MPPVTGGAQYLVSSGHYGNNDDIITVMMPAIMKMIAAIRRSSIFSGAKALALQREDVLCLL